MRVHYSLQATETYRESGALPYVVTQAPGVLDSLHPAGNRLLPKTRDSQVGVGAGIARPVAPQGATYYGVPLGTQGS